VYSAHPSGVGARNPKLHTLARLLANVAATGKLSPLSWNLEKSFCAFLAWVGVGITKKKPSRQTGTALSQFAILLWHKVALLQAMQDLRWSLICS